MLHQIGVGALGPVFRTYEPTRDRLVAVKVFRLDVTPEQARLLADELAKAAEAGLFHPSIVEPVAAGLEGTVAYRAEEYVAAESLDVALRHYAPATLDTALPFIAQLASAIDFARGAGVGHGALHPRDIFVTPDEARATGFGVVDALERCGQRAPVRRPYSPPERIAGESWGTAADVFSLGVIAFELLTARRPSGLGADMGPLTGAVLGSREAAIREVLARAMHEDPAQRYSTAIAFASALDQAAEAGRAASAAEPASDPKPLVPESRMSIADRRPPDAKPALSATPDLHDEPLQHGERADHGEHAEPLRDVELKRATAPLSARESAASADLDVPLNLPSVAAAAPVDVIIRATDSIDETDAIDAIASEPARLNDPVVEAVAEAPPPALADADAAPLGLTLDEYAAATSHAPSPGDSPREVARKVIAAREVRKRQVKAQNKPKLDLGDEAAAPILPPADPAPEPELTAIEPQASPVMVVETPPVAEEPAAPVIAAAAVAAPSLFGGVPEPISAAKHESRNDDPAEESVASPQLRAAEDVDVAKDVQAAELEETTKASEPDVAEPPPIRDFPERVVAVDEFRARESSTAKPDRMWRVPDRMATPKPSPAESFDTEMPPPSMEETTSDRSRLVMLPLAVALILGLLLGYTAGYVVGSREKASQLAAAAGASPQTPAANPPVVKDVTEQAVGTTASSSTAPPNVPSDARPTGKRPVPERAAPAATAGTAAGGANRRADAKVQGRLEVTSTPAHAGVTVNKRWRGRTPLTLDGMAPGTYDVRIVEPGYEVARQTITISGKNPTGTMSAKLKPSAKASKTASPAAAPAAKPAATGVGELYVDSRPRGAKVLVDGKDMGVTPLRVPGQPVGSHVIRLELADHAPWTKTETVTTGATARVTGSLERIK